nr:hypothetical protein [Haloarcula quadrata]
MSALQTFWRMGTIWRSMYAESVAMADACRPMRSSVTIQTMTTSESVPASSETAMAGRIS